MKRTGQIRFKKTACCVGRRNTESCLNYYISQGDKKQQILKITKKYIRIRGLLGKVQYAGRKDNRDGETGKLPFLLIYHRVNIGKFWRFHHMKSADLSDIIEANRGWRRMQYKIGDMVVYGAHGACRITHVENRRVDKKEIAYYVLVPTNKADAQFYVPIHNAKAVAKMRKVLTREALTALLESEERLHDSWLANENLRKDKYREMIVRADCTELVCMIRTLSQYKQEQQLAGKKIHLCDENFMRDAERVVASEISVVLGISQEDAGTVVRSALAE